MAAAADDPRGLEPSFLGGQRAIVPVSDPTALTTAQAKEYVSALRELLETRIDGMDTAIELVAGQVARSADDAAAGGSQVLQDALTSISAVRELIESRLAAMDKATELLAATVGKVPSDTDKAVDALRQLLGARIDGMDTATKLLAESVAKFPLDMDRAVEAAKNLIQSQLRAVQDISIEKFAAIDGTFQSNALALTAALAAQKEAAAEQNKSNTLAITKSEQATKETIAANAAQNATANAALLSQVTDLKERVVRLESGGIAATDARSQTRLDRGETVGAAQASAAALRANISMAIAVLAVLVSVIITVLKK